MSSVGAVFSAHAADYDAVRRALVPCFDAFYGSALERVERHGIGQGCRILDLGAGTGLLSAILLDRFPDAAAHLVDMSAAMLDEARRRLAGHRASFAVADYSREPLAGPWDVIVSALSIHHLEPEDQRRLFVRIHDALGPGGLFVNAEQVLAPMPTLVPVYDAVWRAQASSLGASDADIAAARQRMTFDRCGTLADQLDGLRHAGFADVGCAFKQWRFVVCSGTRPG